MKPICTTRSLPGSVPVVSVSRKRSGRSSRSLPISWRIPCPSPSSLVMTASWCPCRGRARGLHFLFIRPRVTVGGLESKRKAGRPAPAGGYPPGTPVRGGGPVRVLAGGRFPRMRGGIPRARSPRCQRFVPRVFCPRRAGFLRPAAAPGHFGEWLPQPKGGRWDCAHTGIPPVVRPRLYPVSFSRSWPCSSCRRSSCRRPSGPLSPFPTSWSGTSRSTPAKCSRSPSAARPATPSAAPASIRYELLRQAPGESAFKVDPILRRQPEARPVQLRRHRAQAREDIPVQGPHRRGRRHPRPRPRPARRPRRSGSGSSPTSSTPSWPR